jgi:hypothetical protein
MGGVYPSSIMVSMTGTEEKYINDAALQLAATHASEQTAIKQENARKTLLAIAAQYHVDHVQAWEVFVSAFKRGGGYLLHYDGTMSCPAGRMLPFDDFF